MKVEKGQVRAPEIGRLWLNSPPLSFRQLRGRVVLVDFWDYTCVNCIRTLPYVQAWHERYQSLGLTVIGVHTPEFMFAQYESNVERSLLEFGLTYPIVVDSNREIWKASIAGGRKVSVCWQIDNARWKNLLYSALA